MGLIQKLFSKSKGRSLQVPFTLGLKKGEPDSRDFRLVGSAALLPLAYKIPNLPPVRNQLTLNSCASHAAVGAYEILLLNKKPHRYLEGSELYHYYNARRFVNKTFPVDKGMSIRDACKTLHKYHMATEYAWPYVPGRVNTEPPFYSYWTSGAYKIKRYIWLNQVEEIKRSICQDIPILCGIPIYDNYYFLNSSGYLYSPKGGERGNHAQVVVGYDDEKQVFLLRNSWGSVWGKQGYCEMSYSDFVKYSFDWWIIEI